MSKVVKLWAQKGSKKKISYKNFKLMSSVRFITPDVCFPCHEFAIHRNCYHRMGVMLREQDEASSSSSGTSESCDSDDDIIEQASRKRGRPKPKKSMFTGERKWKLSRASGTRHKSVWKAMTPVKASKGANKKRKTTKSKLSLSISEGSENMLSLDNAMQIHEDLSSRPREVPSVLSDDDSSHDSENTEGEDSIGEQDSETDTDNDNVSEGKGNSNDSDTDHDDIIFRFTRSTTASNKRHFGAGLSPPKTKRRKNNTTMTKKPRKVDTPGKSAAAMPSDWSSHQKYKPSYWLDTNDIDYVMTAMLGSTSHYAAQPYDAVAKGLSNLVVKYNAVQDRDERAERLFARKNKRWGQWTTQVTNCSPVGERGHHWVLTSTKFSTQPRAMVWDPLGGTSLCMDVIKCLQQVCGKDGVATRAMKQQDDGWSCGYISTWWALHNDALHRMSQPPMESPPEIHEDWHEIVWLLLQIRDVQDKLGDDKGATDLKISSHLQLAWNGNTVTFGANVKEDLQDELSKLMADLKH